MTLSRVGPANKLEAEIFNVWREVLPVYAFEAGVKGTEGRFFVPSVKNIRNALAKIRLLLKQASMATQRKFLRSIEAVLTWEEPQVFLGSALDALFDHTVKLGIEPKSLKVLTRGISEAAKVARGKFGAKKWPMEIRVLTTIRGNGVLRLLSNIRSSTTNIELVRAIDRTTREIKGYLALFKVRGVKDGSFKEVYPVLSKSGGNIGRRQVYARLVKNKYDYPESPTEIEQKGLRWLRRELPRLKEAAAKLAKKNRVKASVEAVSAALKKKSGLKGSMLVDFTNKLREKVVKVVDKHIVGVNPRYDTRVLETPPYLANSITTAAASFYDGLTTKPYQYYFVTVDEKWAPPSGVGDLLQTLIHEEYGHCLHGSNSALAYGAKPGFLGLLWTPLGGPVSEGISFYRELEFFQVLKQIQRTREGKEEQELYDFLERNGGFDDVLEEYEFTMYEWRVMRFLRAIGDVRINLGKQSVTEFIDWAHKVTGLSKNLIYTQIFPAFQGVPGYAPCYSMTGESIRAIQGVAKRTGRDLREFNTYACSLGFPPRTVFEEKLREHAGVSG